ncbi:MAG TPA: hypothetical protein VJP83_06360 [Terriglobales bacterium]|nr:hypothetical protein [Terriglobales bacterium]
MARLRDRALVRPLLRRERLLLERRRLLLVLRDRLLEPLERLLLDLLLAIRLFSPIVISIAWTGMEPSRLCGAPCSIRLQ